MKVALSYSRQSKSNTDDGTDSLSVAAQERRIADYASRNDFRIESTYHDVDVRGTVAHRLGLDALLTRVERGGINAVIVYDVSRLSRDTELFIRLLNQLKRHGVELISTREPASEEWLQVLFASLAQRDRGLLSVRIADAVRERARLGQRHGAAPLGYTRVEEKAVDGRIIRRFTPNEDAGLVRDLFARYDGGASLIGLARWLNEPGHPRPARAARWSMQTVQWILRNQVYVGDVVIKQRGQHVRLVVEDTHEAIVPRALFDRVQRRMDALGRRETTRLRKPGRNWLEGRVYCACGAVMYFFMKKHVHIRKTWFCKRQTATRALTSAQPPCSVNAREIGNRRIEPYVRKQFARDLQAMVDTLPANLGPLADRPDTLTDALDKRLADIATARRRLVAAIVATDDPALLIAEDNRLAADERALVEQRANQPPPITPERLAAAVAVANDIAGLLQVATLADDQALLTGFANRVGLRVTVEGPGKVVLEYDSVFGRLLCRE